MVFSSISCENSPLHWISTEHKLQSLVSLITPYGYSSQVQFSKRFKKKKKNKVIHYELIFFSYIKNIKKN